MSDVPERLKKALDAIEYMPNAVYAWEKAHQGDRSLARRNAEKVREAERLLGEILASLPAALSYEVYGLKQKPLRFESKRDLIHGLSEFGIQYMGDEGRRGLKPELLDQPKFDSLVGPMYGGPGVVRYETADVNERLSR